MATEEEHFNSLKKAINRIDEIAKEEPYSVVSLGVIPNCEKALLEINKLEQLLFEEDDHEYDEAATIGDEIPTLPAQDFEIRIKRVKKAGCYETSVWFNRKTRRFYIMGLLQEVLASFMSNATEVTWIGDDSPDNPPDDGNFYPAFAPKL